MTNANKEKVESYLVKEGVKEYQKQVFKEFGEIIATPSVDFNANGYIKNDHRQEIKEEIEKIRDKFGLGVATVVLHAQQFISGHIPLEIKGENLAKKSDIKIGKNGEQFLYVPLRKYRNNIEILKELGIIYKHAQENKYTSHETDKKPCFYCSCGEMNPHEIVIDHVSKKLSDAYKIGFTFAPFGRPDQVVHFLAWNKPKEGDYVPDMTFNSNIYSDLVEFVIEVNESIQRYFKGLRIKDFPTIDGVHNGWAGNTLYHNHFQFVDMENDIPILSREKPLWTKQLDIKNGKVAISKINWPLSVYRIEGETSLHKEAGAVVGIKWQSSSDTKCLYRDFGRLISPGETDFVHVHAANLFIPGKEMGKVGYFVARDFRNVDAQKLIAGIPPKKSLAVLESLGAFIIDDESMFKRISNAEEPILSLIATSWLSDLTPEEPCFFLETL